MTITHVDYANDTRRDHLTDLERTVAALTLENAELKLELAVVKLAHFRAEAELAASEERLAAYRVTTAAQQEWIEKRSGVERRQVPSIQWPRKGHDRRKS